MNVEILKRIRIERYIFAGLMAFLMIAIAEISGEKEIIFPEICALTIGAWISEQQPWNCNKRNEDSQSGRKYNHLTENGTFNGWRRESVLWEVPVKRIVLCKII